MPNRLARSLSDVDADVVAIETVAADLDVPAHIGHEIPDRRSFRRAEREEVRFVPARHDQRVIGCQRETVGEGGGQSVGRNQVVAPGVLARDAGHRP